MQQVLAWYESRMSYIIRFRCKELKVIMYNYTAFNNRLKWKCTLMNMNYRLLYIAYLFIVSTL